MHPAAVAWADASSVFDPYDILQIPSTLNATATVVKKAYCVCSMASGRTAHPDKGGDAETFRKIQNAHAALAGDVTARTPMRCYRRTSATRTARGVLRGLRPAARLRGDGRWVICADACARVAARAAPRDYW